MQEDMRIAAQTIRQGGIVAHPTEAVFGLGCDPFNEMAVKKILQLKHRSIDKGLILIASKWQHLSDLIAPIESTLLNKALQSWPGPITWVFPAAPTIPQWITGKNNSIALRITAHPTAKMICDLYDGAIVSTSANIEGEKPARSAIEVKNYFPSGIDFIIDGAVGNLKQPTSIHDILTDKILRN